MSGLDSKGPQINKQVPEAWPQLPPGLEAAWLPLCRPGQGRPQARSEPTLGANSIPQESLTAGMGGETVPNLSLLDKAAHAISRKQQECGRTVQHGQM